MHIMQHLVSVWLCCNNNSLSHFLLFRSSSHHQEARQVDGNSCLFVCLQCCRLFHLPLRQLCLLYNFLFALQSLRTYLGRFSVMQCQNNISQLSCLSVRIILSCSLRSEER